MVANLWSSQSYLHGETKTCPLSFNILPETQEYLKDIRSSKLDVDVELLIGTNVAKSMEPWEIISSQGDGDGHCVDPIEVGHQWSFEGL